MKVLRFAQRSMRNIAWLLALLILWLAFVLPVHAKAIEIPLHKRAGVYSLPVRINGVITLNFILDSGASDVAIPADVAMTLIRTGTITENDFLPGKSYRLADGSRFRSTRLILREMEFGGIRITNVPCLVTPPASDILLGQSLLERLSSWKLDNKKRVLIVYGQSSLPHPRETQIAVDVQMDSLYKFYENRKDYKGMQAFFRKAAAQNPNSPSLHKYLLEADTKLGDKKGALHELEQLIRLQPKQKEYYRLAAYLYEQTGNYAQASKNLEALLKMDFSDKAARQEYERLKFEQLRKGN